MVWDYRMFWLTEVLGLWASSILTNAEHSVAMPLGRDEDKEVELLERLMARCNPAIRPAANGSTTDVTIDFFVQSFGPLNEADMDFSMEIFLRQEWVDSKLTFTNHDSPIMVPIRYIDNLWQPDLFFPNEKRSSYHDVLHRNGVTRLYPNGTIWTSVRMTLHLHCPMDFVYYPFDYQECSVQISSYAHTNDSVNLVWREDPIEIQEAHLHLPQFELLTNTSGHCTQLFKTGRFACLEATFRFRRLVGFYMLQNYMPCMLIVMLSWISFWISRDSVAARISLGVTTVLTLTTQLSAFRNTLHVSYPKAIDVWYTLCSTFVFGALLEFVVVNVLSRYEKRFVQKRSKDGEREDTQDELLSSSTIARARGYGHKSGTPSSLSSRFHNWLSRITAKGIDTKCRVVFPVLYFSLTIIYWIYYIRL